MSERRALTFACGGNWLYGVLDLPAREAHHGVVFIVGGPQYRAGSHRQFTLLARQLAADGIAAMRFDYRGMGDSEGTPHSFDNIGDDVRAAIDTFFDSMPALREVSLFGLCDGASAAAMYAAGDPRVGALVLVNPWVHTEAGAARTRMKHYYRARMSDPALWRKIFTASFDYGAAWRSLGQLIEQRRTISGRGSLPDRIRAGLRRFDGKVLIVLGGADLTAREFEATAASPAWAGLMKQGHIRCRTVASADHTFSRPAWHEELTRVTAQFLLEQ